MKLASLNGGRDGGLLVVTRALDRATPAADIAPTLQCALDHWSDVVGRLSRLAEDLESRRVQGTPFDAAGCAAPLPRAFHWVDGSAYVSHIELVRKARGAEMPPSFWTSPIIYQGGSDTFLGPRQQIPPFDEASGIDFEAEVAYVVDDTPMGCTPAEAEARIRLVMLVNDVTLRNLVPDELAKGFGFYVSKPSSAFSPVAVTLDELGSAWRNGKLHRPLQVHLNGRRIGAPDAGTDATFSPGQLIAYAAQTRSLGAGTIVGTGTVSNRDASRGACCLAEVRAREMIAGGAPVTPFLRGGDRVRIEMLDEAGASIFGAIDQTVTRRPAPGR